MGRRKREGGLLSSGKPNRCTNTSFDSCAFRRGGKALGGSPPLKKTSNREKKKNVRKKERGESCLCEARRGIATHS